MAFFRNAERRLSVIDSVVEVVGNITSLLFVPMTSCILAEMILRYIFNSPTIWANETAQYLFGYLFLLGGAYTLKYNGHIRVEVLFMYLSRKGQLILSLISYPFTLVYLIAVVWYSGAKALDSMLSLERAFSVWEPYLFPVLIAVPIGGALMLLQCLLMLIRDICHLIDANNLKASSHEH